MKVDLNKKYKTRSGLDVVITQVFSESSGYTYTVRGYIIHEDGNRGYSSWTQQGKYDSYTKETHRYDLVEVQEESPWNNPDKLAFRDFTEEQKQLFYDAERLGCRFEWLFLNGDKWSESLVSKVRAMFHSIYRIRPDDLHKVYPQVTTDLTKIDKPFGELDRKTQVSLLESYYLDDNSVEFRTHSEDKWHEIYGNPSWSGHIRYRLKPESTPQDTLHNATVMVSPEGEPKVDTLVVGEPISKDS